MSDLTEQFNKRRMDRCIKVWRAISHNCRKTNSFEYRVVCVEPLEGKTLEELGKLYFSVGVGDDLADLPLIDLLVVFSLIAAERQQLQKHQGQRDFKLDLRAKTSFTEDDVFSMLNCIQIDVRPEIR